jgi:hypothetical protein
VRPLPLKNFIVAIGKERIFVVIEHGLEEMKSAKPISQKNLPSFREP